MRSGMVRLFLLLAVCIAGVVLWRALAAHRAPSSAASNLSQASPASWNRQAAARYLDAREEWWQNWPPAHKDHGTVCVSCHTVVPYAFVRPLLRRDLGETAVPAVEKTMVDSVEKRVNHWSEMTPYYSDAVDGPGKTAQSHATEAVLNAVILASYDTQTGHLRPVTRKAFDDAWALQEETGEKAGGWKWQDFQLAPWESAESGYQGAAMLALAVGGAPEGYAGEPGVREHMERLKDYLRRGYAAQPVMSQLYVLRAAAKVPGLLTSDEKKELIAKVETLQEPDGGWRLESLDKQTGMRSSLREAWKQVDNKVQSDGVATGLVVLAMEDSGATLHDGALRRGVDWLKTNQNPDGKWQASSMNGLDPDSSVGRFMSDAATGYAVLALEGAPGEPTVGSLR